MAQNYSNTELMKAMGSKNGSSDPEPPDQWLYDLRHSTCDTAKAIAWVKSKTVAYGHRSPFCVDEHGEPVGFKHMALDLGWAERTARNVLNQIKKQGRVRTDEDGRIWLCADIPNAYCAVESDKKVLDSDSVQSHFTGYLLEIAEKLPPEVRATAERQYGAFLPWRDRLFAEGMAKLRSIADRYEDSTLDRFGMKKKRLAKEQGPSMIPMQLELLADPDFDSVQSHAEEEFVQTEEDDLYEEQATPYSPDPADASFMGSDTDTDKTTTTAEPAGEALLEEDVAVVSKYLQITQKAARKFLIACRTADPDCSVQYIVNVIDKVTPTISRNVRNPRGLILTIVPEKIALHRAEQEGGIS